MQVGNSFQSFGSSTARDLFCPRHIQEDEGDTRDELGRVPLRGGKEKRKLNE